MGHKDLFLGLPERSYCSKANSVVLGGMTMISPLFSVSVSYSCHPILNSFYGSLFWPSLFPVIYLS